MVNRVQDKVIQHDNTQSWKPWKCPEVSILKIGWILKEIFQREKKIKFWEITQKLIL